MGVLVAGARARAMYAMNTFYFDDFVKFRLLKLIRTLATWWIYLPKQVVGFIRDRRTTDAQLTMRAQVAVGAVQEIVTQIAPGERHDLSYYNETKFLRDFSTDRDHRRIFVEFLIWTVIIITVNYGLLIHSTL